MTSTSFPAEHLALLPESIWIPSPENAIFRGTPAEMIQEMTPEPLQGQPLRSKVKFLLGDLAKKRALVIGLPGNVEDDVLAGLFVYALLDVGVARPAFLA